MPVRRVAVCLLCRFGMALSAGLVAGADWPRWCGPEGCNASVAVADGRVYAVLKGRLWAIQADTK